MSKNDMTVSIQRYGLSNGVRHLRNIGVPFEAAYIAAFGCAPRR